MKMVCVFQTMTNTVIKLNYMTLQEKTCFKTYWMDTIAAFLLMAKQVLEKVIQCLDMNQIQVIIFVKRIGSNDEQ